MHVGLVSKEGRKQSKARSLIFLFILVTVESELATSRRKRQNRNFFVPFSFVYPIGGFFHWTLEAVSTLFGTFGRGNEETASGIR